MGHWGVDPWDNDIAADWFGELFDETKFADKVREALQDERADWEVIWAATHVLVQLGRVYIWPIDHLDDDLKLAIARMEEVVDDMVREDGNDEFVDKMRRDIAELQSRLHQE